VSDGSRPNILVIWGDDIGITNLSCYSDGLMGYRTPNIDRIADEGMRLQAEDPTIAELLKPLAYATGRFGKNHLGDRSEYLPTAHGFDEFFGNLYHLNAEEDPESPNYPQPADFPQFRERFEPRGVLHSWATDSDDDTDQPRWGRVGRQRIEDTGPLTKKRMETIDDEIPEHALDFIDRQHQAQTPFFVWFDTTHMHLRTHPKPETIDGFNLLPYLTGEVDKSPRQGFIYFSDDGDVLGIRFDNWKVVFMEQRAQGTFQIWAEPFVPLRLPKLFNLRTDPFERADVTSNTYWDWVAENGILVITASAIVAQFLKTFKKFPPRQKAASFTIDQAVAKLEASLTAGH